MGVVEGRISGAQAIEGRSATARAIVGSIATAWVREGFATFTVVAHSEEGDLLVMLSVFRITSQGTHYVGSGLNSDSDEIGLVMPRACTIRGIGVSSGAVVPSPGSYEYTLFKNGVATGITGTLSGATKTGVFTGSVSGSAGDKIACRIVVAGSAPAAYHTIVLDVDWSS